MIVSWLQMSQIAYLVAFFLYCASFMLYIVTIAGQKMNTHHPTGFVRYLPGLSRSVMIAGFSSQLIYFISRWVYAGHIPVSNMYEFISFLSMMVIAAYIVLYFLYRKFILGLFSVLLAFLLMAYASIFPREIQPLIPALHSIWLYIHVTLAALSYAFFGVGFVTGLLYLLRTVHWEAESPRNAQRWLEFIFGCIMIFIGFLVVTYAFRVVGYEVVVHQKVEMVKASGEIEHTMQPVVYHLPPIIVPYYSDEVSLKAIPSFSGLKLPLIKTWDWIKEKQTSRMLNTIIWALLVGMLLYVIICLSLRKPIAQAIQPLFLAINPEHMDEISYRSIAIGFPIFTIGALFFAMIWAQLAWARFWGWDPKEVWAFVTWLFYSTYLHLRLSRNWHGAKSAWLSVIGFIIVMFTLVGVNLMISGLHSYTGV